MSLRVLGWIPPARAKAWWGDPRLWFRWFCSALPLTHTPFSRLGLSRCLSKSDQIMRCSCRHWRSLVGFVRKSTEIAEVDVGDSKIEVPVALGGPPGGVWSRILDQNADGTTRHEGYQRRGHQEGASFGNPLLATLLTKVFVVMSDLRCRAQRAGEVQPRLRRLQVLEQVGVEGIELGVVGSTRHLAAWHTRARRARARRGLPRRGCRDYAQR